MKSVKMYVLACLSAVFLLAGCGSDPVKEDLTHYFENDLPKMAAQEKEIADQFTQISANKQLDPQSVIETLDQQVIGKYAAFLAELEKIQPETPEVQQVHAQYLEASRLNQEALEMIVQSLKEKNQEQYVAARAKLDEASEKVKQSKTAIKELADQYGVQ
jgi:hypothetical protein